MPLNESQKLTFLSLVKEKKDLLMGEFGTNLTKADKADGWQDVVRQCCEFYGFDPTGGRTWSYCRDGVWNNMRMSTLRKLARNTKLNECGMQSIPMNQIDELVLDILGGKDLKVDLKHLCLPLLNTPFSDEQSGIQMDEQPSISGVQLRSVENSEFTTVLDVKSKLDNEAKSDVIWQPSISSAQVRNPENNELTTGHDIKSKVDHEVKPDVIWVKIEDSVERKDRIPNEEPMQMKTTDDSRLSKPAATIPTITVSSAKSVIEKRQKPTCYRKEIEEEMFQLKKSKLELEVQEKRLNCINLRLRNEKLELELMIMKRNMNKPSVTSDN